MLLLSILVAGTLLFSPDSEPKNGDTGAIIHTEFTSVPEAMEFVVRQVLLPMDILPLRHDATLGYLVTERTLYKGYFNCDYIFSFLDDNGKVVIRCRPREYESSRTLDTFSDYSMSYNQRAMKGSLALAYWDRFRKIVSSIPSVSVDYYGSEDDKQIKEFD